MVSNEDRKKQAQSAVNRGGVSSGGSKSGGAGGRPTSSSGARAGSGQSNRGYDFKSVDRFGNVTGSRKGVPYSYSATEYQQQQEQQRQQQEQQRQQQEQQRQQQQRNQEIQKQQEIQRDNRREQSGYYPGISDYEGIPRNVQSGGQPRPSGYYPGISDYEGIPKNKQSVSGEPPTTVSLKQQGPNLKEKVFFVGSNAQGYTIESQKSIEPRVTSSDIFGSNQFTRRLDKIYELNKPVSERSDKPRVGDPVGFSNRELGELSAPFLNRALEAKDTFIATGEALQGKKAFEWKKGFLGIPTYSPIKESQKTETTLDKIVQGKPVNLSDKNQRFSLYGSFFEFAAEWKAFGAIAKSGTKAGEKISNAITKARTEKIPLIESPSNLQRVPKNAYITRKVPRDIFKADKAQPIQFKQTSIQLGKGLGKLFDPSSSGVNTGKIPPFKPSGTSPSTKTELDNLPTTEIKTKGGQIVLQAQKETPKTKQKTKPQFKSYPVMLGEAEAKIIKLTQSPTKSKLYPLQTPKKKKQPTQTSAYIFDQEILLYPKQTQKESFQSSVFVQMIQNQKQSFFVPPIQKQNQKQSFFVPPIQKQNQKQSFFVPPATKLDTPTVTEQTFFRPPPQKPPIEIPPQRFVFPPYFPSAFFGSGGYESPSSLKKAFAAYGISSDINIKTLPTYSRYSSGTNIFKEQAKEDIKIQNLFYGKPKKKSKTAKSKSKKKSRKR